ncbi:MAG: PRC-barrel domain-containing protein [Phenylobacterium sp.]|uniref:PRC-barrel domain-containing protein n=1 Tax=Phenylobacterium sp. TaxID=1871053 RepID=UPI002734CF9A|nr:PRC-barrel domain-containing protein [Phenylobacterium sp.]MDP3176123.1 PRC-barrel domain-containing protein [Phenylobacterium sp.]
MSEAPKPSEHDLISAHRVEGATVYSAEGRTVGVIRNLMIEKQSGHVRSALVSKEGSSGANQWLAPVPWSELRYDTGLGGYVVDATKLENAPWVEGDAALESDLPWRGKVYSHWVAQNYWGMS